MTSQDMARDIQSVVVPLSKFEPEAPLGDSGYVSTINDSLAATFPSAKVEHLIDLHADGQLSDILIEAQNRGFMPARASTCEIHRSNNTEAPRKSRPTYLDGSISRL